MATPPPIDPDVVMAGLKLKLQRARALLDTLMDDIDRVLTAGSEGPPKLNPDGSFSSFYVPREEPSPAWGVVLGDLAHNLRSTLDNVVTTLVVRNGGVPEWHHKFPIFTADTEWSVKVANRWPDAGPLAGVSREDFDVVQTAQPFHEGGAAPGHPLAVLNRINNADKHAALHGAVACLATTGSHRVLAVEPKMSVEILWTREPLTPLEAGGEMTQYRLPGPIPEGGFRVLLNWPLTVRFTDHKGRSVGSRELPDVFNAVTRVVANWDDEVRADQQ
jgi:hypothetical protein